MSLPQAAVWQLKRSSTLCLLLILTYVLRIANLGLCMPGFVFRARMYNKNSQTWDHHEILLILNARQSSHHLNELFLNFLC